MNDAPTAFANARAVELIPIGQRGTHGIFAGIARGRDGAEDYALDLLDDTNVKNMKWKDAQKWAESLGATLPTRAEAALLFANLRDQFEPDWYWTCEQLESDPAYACIQSFSTGYQGYYLKVSELRARAVRRSPLSVIR